MKKLLALVLALVMSMSLVTISNAAFKDADKIDHTEAVEVMNALGVINGMPDGSFNPSGNVTRAEMAKMITIIMLGDIDAAAFKGTATDLTDINGHWAEGYIKYCYSQGVIAGRGDGTFAPNANVTAVEAAKMLLVAIGYNATVQGYVGSQWSINIIRDAQLSKFFDKLSVTSNKVLTRDEAAQMIYNAVNAKIIEKSSSVDRLSGKVTDTYTPHPTKTLLSETFGAAKKYGYLNGSISYDSVKKNYTYSVSNDGTFGAIINTTNDDGIADNTALTTSKDYSSLYGQKVAVVYKDSKTVYGIYSDAKVLATGTTGKVTDTDGNAIAAGDTDTTVKFGDTKVKLNSAANVIDYFIFNATSSAAELDDLINGATNANKFSELAAIDNNDDGKADLIVYYPATAAKVTYVGTSSITAGSNYAYDKDEKTYSADSGTTNYVFPAGIAKNDYVLIPGYGVSGATREMSKIEIVEGKVTAEKSTSAQIGGTWYTKLAQTLSLGDTYQIAVVNGYAVGSKVVSASSKDVAMVIAEEAATALSGIKAKVMFPDGKTEIITISKINGTDVANGNTLATTAGLTALDSSADSDRLITYKKLSDGTYDVTKASGSNKAGYDVYVNDTDGNYTKAVSSSNTPAYLDGKLIADDAVIFVQYNNAATAKYTVITGAALKTYTNTTTVNVESLSSTTNGVDTIKVAYMSTAATNFGTSSSYGYVLTAPYATKDSNDTTVYAYDIWTTSGKLSVQDTKNTVAGVDALTKGDLITYVQNTDGTVTSTKLAEDTDYQFTAVTAYSEGDKLIALASDEGADYTSGLTAIKDKTEILYVDTKNHTGSEGGAIELAQATPNGGYYLNSMAVYTGGELKLLVIDTSNELNGAQTATGNAVTAATFAASYPGWTIATNKTNAVEGETVTVTITSNGTGAQNTAAIAVTGATSPSNVTLTASTAKSYTIEITMGATAITAISVTLS